MGTKQTLQVMATLAREAAKDKDFLVVARKLGSISAVDSFIRARYAYRDEREEIVRTPQFMLADMGRIEEDGRIVGLEGDCDDVATLYAAFACALGYHARLVAIRYNEGNPNFEHVFTEAYDGDWRILDATMPAGSPMMWIEDMMENVC